MEEFKKAEDRLKELEEEWKGIQEARRQRQEEWERQWEERRTRDEKREKERRRLEGRRKILEDLEKWKEEKRREDGYGLEVSDAEEDEGQQYLSSKWSKWEWDSINEEYLRRQYHDLICVFPYQVRRTLISIIPTLDDLREKTNEYTTFSGTLRHKYELDQFIEIFRFINNEYPFQITDIGFLYQQMTGRQPHHDLTLDESVTLRLLENTPKRRGASACSAITNHAIRHQAGTTGKDASTPISCPPAMPCSASKRRPLPHPSSTSCSAWTRPTPTSSSSP
jgi:hypothetical protein